jgi:hypothetical protein
MSESALYLLWFQVKLEAEMARQTFDIKIDRIGYYGGLGRHIEHTRSAPYLLSHDARKD